MHHAVSPPRTSAQRWRCIFAPILSWVVALVPSPAPGQDATAGEFRPLEKPTLAVERAPASITIDGRLDDPGWAGAARARGFSETFPTERGEPPVGSEAWIAYDDNHLYLALVAEDDPATLRVTWTARDEIWSGDYFGILLDTYGNAEWAYFLFANPFGVQGDSRFSTANGEDDSFDIVYDSEARITDRGYQIEIAIPFASLRFPDAPEQTWRATFWRTRPRSSRATYSWAALDRDVDCFLCQYGTLTGIRGVEPGGSLEILPSVVASRSATLGDIDDPGAGLDDPDLDAEGALNARFSHPSGITVEGTVNPDFSQVESDVAQIDVNTTFALFFPERRPFFQEGSELFDTNIDAVYTRQINDPLVATKLLGRFGKTTLAWLAARDETSPILLPFEERSFVGLGGESYSNILRIQRSLGAGSQMGALVTDRRFDGGGYGTTYGADVLWRIDPKWRLEGQVLGSRTMEPDAPEITAGLEGLTFDDGRNTAVFDGESFSGVSPYAGVFRSAEFWSSRLEYRGSSPTFRADNGFEFRNDLHEITAFNEWSWYPEADWIDQFIADIRVARAWNFDGTLKEELYQPTVELSLAGQTFVEIGHEWVPERFEEIEFDGVRRWFVFANSDFSEVLEGGFFLEFGRSIARFTDPPSLGEGFELNTFATFRPLDRLTIEPEFDFSRLEDAVTGEELFSGYVFRTKTNLFFGRGLFVRFVLQYDDFDERWDVEPLVTYRINPFTVFFAGSTQAFTDFGEPHDVVESERQLFAKLQYLFQL